MGTGMKHYVPDRVKPPFVIFDIQALTAADAWTVADDRSTWRALQPTAGYAQQ